MLALMQGSRRSARVILGLGIVLSTGYIGCTTSAVAIQECRDIEAARCEASVPCGVIEADEVESCQRFYRDQCLHGISGSKEPTSDEQKTCLELINDAAEVAEKTMSFGMGGEGGVYELACEVIAAPWKHPDCAFVVADDGAGGAEAEN